MGNHGSHGNDKVTEPLLKSDSHKDSCCSRNTFISCISRLVGACWASLCHLTASDNGGGGHQFGLWVDRSQADARSYREGYRGKEDNLALNDNYLFYSNEIPSRPDGDFIDHIHCSWKGEYDKLECHHGYIQWLFPIREQGTNSSAQELQRHEAEKICSDPIMHARVLKSYELMLDFYGMKLKDKATGEIERSDNWKERFSHLNNSSHNYLRITRILKCLGEMKYEHLKAPFLRFVLHEAIVEGTLDRTLDSCMNYWLEVIKDDQERASIKKEIKSINKV